MSTRAYTPRHGLVPQHDRQRRCTWQGGLLLRTAEPLRSHGAAGQICQPHPWNTQANAPDINRSLQEVAPLANAFVGGYFLSSYLSKFVEAVTVATAKFNEQHAVPGEEKRAYTLVKQANVGLTTIMLFALEPHSIEGLELAETSFGTADIGNKGAVALRFLFSTASEDAASQGTDVGDGILVKRRVTELTFVAAHLAAMEWNLPIRNQNWRSIMSCLLFEDPRSILPEVSSSSRKGATSDSDLSNNEEEPLLESSEDDEDAEEGNVSERKQRRVVRQLAKLDPQARKRLHDSTIFKPSSQLFVAGDLNYRISAQKPEPEANFPSLNPESEHHHPHFFAAGDQLVREMKAGRTLNGLAEVPVAFPPTYKYSVLSEGDENADPECNTEWDGNGDGPEHAKVWWKFAGHRWPSWCDRVLFRDVTSLSESGSQVEVDAYDAMPVVKTSDHRGVFLRARVPLLKPETFASLSSPPAYSGDLDPESQPAGITGATPAGSNAVEAGEASTEVAEKNWTDTCLCLPAPVDRDAWVRRDAARRKEIVLGWSMILWGTKEGALAIVGGLAVGVGSWYVGGCLMGG